MKKNKLFFLLPILSVFMLTSCLDTEEETPKTLEYEHFLNFTVLNNNALGFSDIAKNYADIYHKGGMRVEMEVLEENTELGTATLKISFDKLETPGDYVNGTMLVMLSSGGDMDERIEVQLDNVIPRAATNAYYNGAISRWLWFAESDNRQNYDIILNGFSYRTSGVEFILNYSYIIQIEGAKTTETSDDKVTWSNGSGSGMFGEVNFTVDMITPVVRSYSAGGYIQGEYRFFAPAINPNFTVKHSLNSIAVSSKDGNIYTYPF